MNLEIYAIASWLLTWILMVPVMLALPWLRCKLHFSARSQVQLGNFSLLLWLISIALMLTWSSSDPLMIVSAQDFESTRVSAIHHHNQQMISNEAFASLSSQGVHWLTWLVGTFCLWMLVVHFYRVLTLCQRLRRCIAIRSVGRVKVVVADWAPAPFSFHTGFSAYVVVPTDTIASLREYRIAVLHELQHHRAGDTLWVHAHQLLKAAFSWNPIVHLWVRHMSLCHEMACDAALIGRKAVAARVYACCLLEVASRQLPMRSAGTCAMAASVSATQLTQRIHAMNHMNHMDYTRGVKGGRLLLGALMLGLCATSIALAKDRVTGDLTIIEAKKLFGVMKSGNDFPVEINDRILRQLNRYIGTADGREFIKDALARRSSQLHLYQKAFKQHHAPRQLHAVALMESGFRNVPAATDAPHSAGVWQFIPSTARNYGLRVDHTVDERLDIALETDAALRLLTALELRFKDWRLAILSYNTGESRVQHYIDELGTRDPWKLIEGGLPTDANYLAKVMAGVLILENRSLVGM